MTTVTVTSETGPRMVDINSLHIPDLWHVALRQKSAHDREAILEVWHIAHSLRAHIAAESTPDVRTAIRQAAGWDSECLQRSTDEPA